MLVEIPFEIEAKNKSKYSGRVVVDPTQVAAINRGYDRIIILMAGAANKAFMSTAPKTKMAVANGKLFVPGEGDPDAPVFEGMPDDELLNKWYDETIRVVNDALVPAVDFAALAEAH